MATRTHICEECGPVTFNDDAKKLRDARKHLRDLTRGVEACLRAIDAEMAKPSSCERGKRIAAICNKLNLCNDIAKRYGLAPTTKERTYGR